MNDMHELSASYALGELDDAERVAFEAHLAECAACRDEVAELTASAEALFWASEEDPPAGLQDRVMTSIGEGSQVARLDRRRRLSRVLTGAVAATIVLLVGVFATNLLRTDPVDAVLTAADAVTVPVTQTPAYTGAATVELTYSNDLERAVVTATGLTEVAGDRTYQMWIIGDGGPVSAGLFVPGSGGGAEVVVDGVPALGTVFGITAEPSGGSPQPTGDVLFAGEV